MKCIKCGEEVDIPDRAYKNLETYNPGGTVTVASDCCGAGYTVSMEIHYKIYPYKGPKKEDDWGEKIYK